MTTQPIKNDQAAVAQMVQNRMTPLPAVQRDKQQINQQSAVSSVSDNTVNGKPRTSFASDALRGNESSRGADKAVKPAVEELLTGATKSPARDVVEQFGALQSEKEAWTVEALAVRTSKAVEQQMQTMQLKMEGIVNSYPPFLRGSEERREYLMSISGIRNQIESMIIPPVNQGDPGLNLEATKDLTKIWENMFEDLFLPKLGISGLEEATDEQISEAAVTVEAQITMLAGRRENMQQNAVPGSPLQAQAAQYVSINAGQILAKAGLSLSKDLAGVLKGL